MYQPKTGTKCSCKRGVQRDNCPTCEGTGLVIDFRAIRAQTCERLGHARHIPATVAKAFVCLRCGARVEGKS